MYNQRYIIYIPKYVCITIEVSKVFNFIKWLIIYGWLVLQNVSEVCRDSGGGVVKKSGSEAGAAAPKRPRNETPSPLPAFKVQ